MTTQTKTFIELSDILTIRLTCEECGCTLSVPISRDMSRTEESHKLDACPMCRAFWVSRGNATYHPLIAAFIGGINNLQSTLATAKLGFALSLELAQPTEESE